MSRLKQEREQRKKLIEDGNVETIYIDRSLIETPSIGKEEYSETQSQIADESKNSQYSRQTPEILKVQQEKLQEMKQNLMKNKESKKQTYFDKLAEPKSIVQEEREFLKQEQEKKMLAELPFRPELSDQTNLLAQIKYCKYEGIPIYERLKILEQERLAHIDELKLMINQQEEEQPLNKVPRPYGEKPPLHERYQQVMQDKQALLEYLKAKQLREEEDLFKPRINLQSQLLAEKNRVDGMNVVDRLVQDGIRKQNIVYSDDLPYDFQPQTNQQINEQIVKGDFSQRQEEFNRKQLEKNMDLESKAYKDYTFRPKLNKQSEQIANRKISQDSLFDRLYSEYQTRQSNIEEKKQEDISKLNFNPELNPKSMEMAVDRTLQDLIKNEYGEYRKQLLKEKYDDSDKECSFYPSVSTSMKYSQMHSQYSFDDCHEKIKQYQTNREQRRSQLKKEQEDEQLKQCTFKPQINKKTIDNNKQIEVRYDEQEERSITFS
ncbi:unnamed protein product (macronuclear) [Paramecium tetraurelia]|uniref:Uncharacterized protein n=1 Tax=Paramecium tetraurelia TaxID=5888 RepID=A0C3K3_PARTE|nr:uncharacterized protein GSPATT00034849001 [Paramecium tetraurelia]CAK65370.1 unnamed protein product [Paramecium tetraurelia]|eukprot:XP_001432767.1 hypothetical protein (macronuclear) [Paramecium tetraurelia strain d4-2]